MTTRTPAEVLNDLQTVFRRVFNDEQLTLTEATTATDIDGWDSLQQIKIILGCEKQFGIKLRARDVNGLGNVGDMVTHLMAVMAKAQRG